MDPLESTLQATKRVAGLDDAGAGDLLKLLREKYLLPKVQKVRTLAEAHGLYEAMGEVEFRTVLAQLDEKKATALLKKLDKHAPTDASERAGDFVNRISDLAGGVAKPSPAASRATARAPRARMDVLPDVRGIYRAEGMDAVASTLGLMSLAELKALVKEQNLKASIQQGQGAPGLRKYVQVAVREEIGSRADVFGTIASLSDQDE